MDSNIIKGIKVSRPNLSENSYKTYLYNLKGIKACMNLNPNKLDSVSFLTNYDKVIKCIADNTKSLASIKAKITAVVVALTSVSKPNKKLIEKYRTYMDDIAKKHNEFISKNEKSDSQEKNWIDYENLIEVCNKLKVEYQKLRKKKKLYQNEYRLLQGYVMLRMQLAYPIRNDFANMKILDEDDYEKLDDKIKDRNNYLVRDGQDLVIHINNYKTSKRLGQKQYKIKPTLTKLINDFLKINTSGYLLVKPSKRNVGLTEVDITKQFNWIFKQYYPDKKISTSMIRHILISHDKKNDPTIKEQQEKNKKIENRYLHSEKMNSQYNKK